MRETLWAKFLDENNKIAINCETIEEAWDVLWHLNFYGKHWATGTSLMSETNYNFGSKTCYNSAVSANSISYYKENGYSVYRFKDVMSDAVSANSI